MLSYGNTINIQNILQSNKLNQSDSWFLNCVILYNNMHMENYTEYKYLYDLVRSFTKIEIHNQEPKKWIKPNITELKIILVKFIELELFPSSCDFENCVLWFIPLKIIRIFLSFCYHYYWYLNPLSSQNEILVIPHSDCIHFH